MRVRRSARDVMSLWKTTNALFWSWAVFDASGMLGADSVLQPGATLGPGKLVEMKIQAPHTQTASFWIITLKAVQAGFADMSGACWQKSGLAHLKLNSPKPQ